MKHIFVISQVLDVWKTSDEGNFHRNCFLSGRVCSERASCTQLVLAPAPLSLKSPAVWCGLAPLHCSYTKNVQLLFNEWDQKCWQQFPMCWYIVEHMHHLQRKLKSWFWPITNSLILWGKFIQADSARVWAARETRTVESERQSGGGRRVGSRDVSPPHMFGRAT